MGRQDNPATLESVWQVAWMLALITVVAAGTAVGFANWRTADVDEYATTQACAAAQSLLIPPSGSVRANQDSAAAAVRLFEEAGVTSHNADRSSGCYEVWRRANMVAAGLKIDRLADACKGAAEALHRQQGLPAAPATASPASAELSDAGVTDGNHMWLDKECAATWRLAKRITPAPSASVPPSNPASSAAASPGTPGTAPAPSSTPSAPPSPTPTTNGPTPTPTDSTAPERWSEQWDGFVTHNATPLAMLGSFLLGGWLALFVLARLLVETPMRRHLVSSRRFRRRIGVLGWTLLMLTPCFIAGAGMAVGAGWLVGPAVVVLFIALAALGLIASLSVAAWLATLLKLTITVDEKSKLNQTQIVERLRGLASGGSGSIKIQSASTIENVSATLTDLSKADWISAVQKVVLFLVGISPWQVTVDAGDREAFVGLARNGRTVHAATVQTAGSGLEPLRNPPAPIGDDEILAVFVAAEILLAMRPWYSEDFDAGLNGATRAQSVALQHIAARWYMWTHDTTDAMTLLKTAVANDPSNQLAVVTLENARWRASNDPEELRDYGNWLDRQLGVGQGQA